MGSGEMVMEDEAKGEVDIVPSGLLPHTGEGTPADTKLRTEIIEPSQFRLQGHNRHDRRRDQQMVATI